MEVEKIASQKNTLNDPKEDENVFPCPSGANESILHFLKVPVWFVLLIPGTTWRIRKFDHNLPIDVLDEASLCFIQVQT